MKEVDENDIEKFIKAKKRIHEDFCIDKTLTDCKGNLVLLAIKRCGLLRDYDRKGSDLLKCLNQKISSNKDLEKTKLEFDFIFKEYEDVVTTAQKKYDKAIANGTTLSGGP